MKNKIMPAVTAQDFTFVGPKSRECDLMALIKSTPRLKDRIEALESRGYQVTQRPAWNGGGVGSTRIVAGKTRMRVSASWGGKRCVYAYCIEY